MELRKLNAADVPSAMALVEAAGWNQLPADWLRLIALEPDGCFCIADGDRLAATTTVTSYGTGLAWVGTVLTHPDYRRRGLARLLMERAVQFIDERGIRTAALDATDMGAPLYESLGFRPVYPVERWLGNLAEAAGAATLPEPALDLEAFGADRSALLARLGTCIRPGRVAAYLGPITARDAASAQNSIPRAAETFWDLIPSNGAAVALAKELGFQQVRQLVRMVRGEEYRHQPGLIYALSGFETG